MKSIFKKAAKVAGVTCIAAGAVALLTSAAAIKAMTEGGRYLKNTVRKIVDEKPQEEDTVTEKAPVDETAAEETV